MELVDRRGNLAEFCFLPKLEFGHNWRLELGTWKVVSNTATTEKGDVNKAAFGQNPSGLLTYTAVWQNDGDHFRR
jgi:lipocalin-like protein